MQDLKKITEHIDEMFSDMRAEKTIETRQCYDVCIGFIEALYWLKVIDDEKAQKLSQYVFEKTMRLLLEEELEDGKLGM